MSEKDKNSITTSYNTNKFIETCYTNAMKMKIIAKKTMAAAQQQTIRIAQHRAIIQGMSLENRYLSD